jgi:3-methyladenine DNA glycosylase AlkD
MTLSEILKQLKTLGNEKMRAQNAEHGAGDNQFGVSLDDIRALAKKIRTDHPLALSLWETGCTSPFDPIWIKAMVSRQA